SRCGTLEFRGYRQAAPARNRNEAKAAIVRRVVNRSADITLGLGAGVGRGRVKGQAAVDVVDVGFDAVDVGILAVVNFREAVLPQEAELELLPALVIDRAVPAHPAPCERRL